jgi:hypothetical protein
MTWTDQSPGLPGRRSAAVVITGLFLLSLGMLVRITYAGMVFGGQPPNPTTEGGTKPQTTGKPTARANVGKGAHER